MTLCFFGSIGTPHINLINHTSSWERVNIFVGATLSQWICLEKSTRSLSYVRHFGTHLGGQCPHQMWKNTSLDMFWPYIFVFMRAIFNHCIFLFGFYSQTVWMFTGSVSFLELLCSVMRLHMKIIKKQPPFPAKCHTTAIGISCGIL